MLSNEVRGPLHEPGEIPGLIPLPGADPDGPDRPSPGAGAVSARAVYGRCGVAMPPTAEFTVDAVRIASFDADGEPDITDFLLLDGVDSAVRAQVLSLGYALQPHRHGLAGMTHVIVSDRHGDRKLVRQIVAA